MACERLLAVLFAADIFRGASCPPRISETACARPLLNRSVWFEAHDRSRGPRSALPVTGRSGDDRGHGPGNGLGHVHPTGREGARPCAHVQRTGAPRGSCASPQTLALAPWTLELRRAAAQARRTRAMNLQRETWSECRQEQSRSGVL